MEATAKSLNGREGEGRGGKDGKAASLDLLLTGPCLLLPAIEGRHLEVLDYLRLEHGLTFDPNSSDDIGMNFFHLFRELLSTGNVLASRAIREQWLILPSEMDMHSFWMKSMES